MTPAEINRAIAEHLGWVRTRIGIQAQNDPEPRGWRSPKGAEWLRCPNYHGSLDAMAEAEKALDMSEQGAYGERLRILSGNVGERGGHFTPNGFGCFALAHLTAPQRAEAFLRTVGKWKEQERVNL